MKNIQLILLFVVLSATLAPIANAQETKPKKDKSCQCTEYIKNCFGITILKSSELKKNNFVKRSAPAVGDIVIFKSSYGDGISTSNGHVGVIYSVTYDSGNKCYKITVRGANQKGPLSNETECGCNNVSNNLTTCVTPSNRKKVQYWRLREK